jgi:hypothetical protein
VIDSLALVWIAAALAPERAITGIRVAVTGGRSYADQVRFDEAMDTVHGHHAISALAHGHCTDPETDKLCGADLLADNWARRHGIPVTAFPADWHNLDVKPCRILVRRGRAYNALAGPNRNVQMLEQFEPDILVVAPGGNGTDHCHANALNMGIPSLEIDG